MDTSSLAVFVNAELLRQYVGRVWALIQVVRTDVEAINEKSIIIFLLFELLDLCIVLA